LEADGAMIPTGQGWCEEGPFQHTNRVGGAGGGRKLRYGSEGEHTYSASGFMRLPFREGCERISRSGLLRRRGNRKRIARADREPLYVSVPTNNLPRFPGGTTVIRDAYGANSRQFPYPGDVEGLRVPWRCDLNTRHAGVQTATTTAPGSGMWGVELDEGSDPTPSAKRSEK